MVVGEGDGTGPPPKLLMARNGERPVRKASRTPWTLVGSSLLAADVGPDAPP